MCIDDIQPNQLWKSLTGQIATISKVEGNTIHFYWELVDSTKLNFVLECVQFQMQYDLFLVN